MVVPIVGEGAPKGGRPCGGAEGTRVGLVRPSVSGLVAVPAGWQSLPGLRGSVAQRVDGARVVTCVYAVEETVWLLTIFDKYEKDNIADKELKALVAAIP